MWGVSVAVGVLAVIGAGVIATVGRMAWPRMTAALTLTGSAGIIGGSFGPALHSAVTKVDKAAGQAVGRLTGTVLVGLVGLIVIGVWALWIYHGQIDLRTIGVSAAVPLVINLIPGVAGTVAIFVVGMIPQIVSGLIGLLFFGTWGG